MKLDSVQQRFGQGGSSSNKNCNPSNICRISLCCCLFGCLAPGIGLLAFTYLSYGNYQKVPAKVVAESFCGYYRRNLLKKTSSSGYNSGTRTSSSSSKQNHYQMTYEFVTLEGENITTATDYCINARRPINSTEYILYDPDDPYTIIHESDASGYLIFGVSLVVIGGVFSCLACVAYKILLSASGNMNGNNNNPTYNSNGMPAEPTEHSQSNSGGNPSAANQIALVISQIWNPNANNNPNTSAVPQNNFSSPDASPAYNVNNNNNNYPYGNPPAENSFGNNNNTYTNADMYGNNNNPYGNTMGNTYANPGNNNGYGDASNSFNDITAAHNFNQTNEYNNNTTFGNNGNMRYNGGNIPVPSAPPAPTASGYRPP